jgi:hypothetical protein
MDSSNSQQSSYKSNSKKNEDLSTDAPDFDTIKMFVGQIPKVVEFILLNI